MEKTKKAGTGLDVTSLGSRSPAHMGKRQAESTVYQTPSQRPIPATTLRTHCLETRVCVSSKSRARKREAAKINGSVVVSSGQSRVYNLQNISAEG